MTLFDDILTTLPPGQHAVALGEAGLVVIFREAEPFGDDWLVLKGIISLTSPGHPSEPAASANVRRSAITWASPGAPIERTP